MYNIYIHCIVILSFINLKHVEPHKCTYYWNKYELPGLLLEPDFVLEPHYLGPHFQVYR